MRRRALAGVLLAAAVILAGCTPPATTPTAWQQTVQSVASQASTGDYASALATLDALEAEVVARRDAGEITAQEADGILSRIATVRADLSSLVPAPTPTPTPTVESTPEQPAVTDDDTTDDGGTVDPGDTGPGGQDPDKDRGKEKGPGKENGGPGGGGGPGKKDG